MENTPSHTATPTKNSLPYPFTRHARHFTNHRSGTREDSEARRRTRAAGCRFSGPRCEATRGSALQFRSSDAQHGELQACNLCSLGGEARCGIVGPSGVVRYGSGEPGHRWRLLLFSIAQARCGSSSLRQHRQIEEHLELKMSGGNTTQLDLEKGLAQMADDNESSSPATMQQIKADTQDSGSKIESPTPEKRESRSKGVVMSSLARNLLAERYKDRFANQLREDEDDTDDEDYNDSVSPGVSRSLISESIELLEKHKELLNLFNRMESSIRLLRLRKKMTTFKNIATQVEVLTKRTFSYSHLAQMKHLFPEAIQITRILLHDEKSLCMYADMEITLVMDVVECTSPDQSPSMAICEAFYSKLLSFLDTHHKGTDIPEAILPEPFNSRSREKLYLEAPNGLAAEPALEGTTEDELSHASHFPQSFQKLMSQKIVADGTEKTQLLPDPAELSSVSAYDSEGINRSPRKQDTHAPVNYEISATPSRHLISCCQENTPKQGTSESPLLVGTPAMQTPKRPLQTPLEKPGATCGHISEPRSASSARRSLKTSLKFEGGSLSYDDGMEHEAAAKRGMFSEDSSSSKSLEEKEPVSFTDKDKINQGPAETQEKIASLRTTFDIVCDISRSAKNCLITKQELFHNILANNLEIEETGEIEEQLHILEDMAPDWISKKVINGGVILYSIEPITDKNSVRARLVEAV